MVEEVQQVAVPTETVANVENTVTDVPEQIADADSPKSLAPVSTPVLVDAQRLARLQESFAWRGPTVPVKRRCPGAWRSAVRRKNEVKRAIRQQAVEFYRLLHERGNSLEQAAQRLSIASRTLRHWERRCQCQSENATLSLIGRPPARSARNVRQTVLDFVKTRGPSIAVSSLRIEFPKLARAELAGLLQRYRRVVHDRYPTSQRRLHWLVPGSVWAIDWAEPSACGGAYSLPPIDGQFPYILAVRDLASGYQLCWQPVPQTTAAVASAVLQDLFVRHGAPLVLKCDNGPSFRAAQMKEFLEQSGVFALFSPPYWPAYNGAIEAAIGSLKSRTCQEASRQGRLDRWTTLDLDAATLAANVTPSRRLQGRCPIEVWAARKRTSAVQRVRFELDVQRHRYDIGAEQGVTEELHLDHWQGSALNRKAIERALVEHDYLLFTRRRIPLTIKS
jgi:transposase InsO family protein